MGEHGSTAEGSIIDLDLIHPIASPEGDRGDHGQIGEG